MTTNEFFSSVLAIIARTETCSLDALYAQFGGKRSKIAMSAAISSLLRRGLIQMVEPRKYRAV